MTIHFELSPYWLEFWCHFFAMFSFMLTGNQLSASETVYFSPAVTFISLFVGIILTAYGCHL